MNALDELQATLTVQEWDIVVQLVSQGPFNAVANIMSKLRSQLEGQGQKPAIPQPPTGE